MIATIIWLLQQLQQLCFVCAAHPRAYLLLHCCCIYILFCIGWRTTSFSAFAILSHCSLCSIFSLSLFYLFAMIPKAVSDQLKNARLTSSTSSQLKHLLSSSLSSSGHHQDPLEAALLAAARSQHGAGIPGNALLYLDSLSSNYPFYDHSAASHGASKSGPPDRNRK